MRPYLNVHDLLRDCSQEKLIREQEQEGREEEEAKVRI